MIIDNRHIKKILEMLKEEGITEDQLPIIKNVLEKKILLDKTRFNKIHKYRINLRKGGRKKTVNDYLQVYIEASSKKEAIEKAKLQHPEFKFASGYKVF